jgi:capsular exopolysaccharide synthesis family protein
MTIQESTSAAEAGVIVPGAPGSNDGAQYELSPDLVTLADNRLAEAEAIRTVRTHIMARHVVDGRRGLAICAPTPGVGCTFTAANLAVSLAQIGVATLLIDGDLRAPSVENFIRPLTPTPGLRQCITSNEVQANEAIHPNVLPNLSVLYSGGATDSAQELLGGETFRRLIESCLRDFEFTIIDTPPTSRCADALRISTTIGYGVIVARRNFSLFNDIATLASQLREDGSRIVGTVLNEV